MKILVVEDEDILSSVLKEKLERAGDTVKVASDGEAGLAAIKTFKPDLVVLDLLLPKKNGFEVLEALRADNTIPDVPVVVVSNLGEDSDIKRALQLGAVDYFVKVEHPLNEIVEKIKNILIVAK